MIVSKEDRLSRRRIEIDLRGPLGNAYYILGTAKNLGENIGMEKSEIKAIQDDMKSSDYDHLIEVFEDHFGDYVVLYR